MEANPNNFFDDLATIPEDLTGRTIIEHKCKDATFSVQKNSYVDNLVQQGLATDFSIEEKNGFSVIKIRVIEPRYTFYHYHHVGLFNDFDYNDMLGELINTASVQENDYYVCNLSIEQDRYIYLNWATSRLRIHDLGNKEKNTLKQLVTILLSSQDIVFEDNKLMKEHGVNAVKGSYKNSLQVSFMQKTLLSKFLISSSKSKVGIRKNVELSGRELITIIREQLKRILDQQMRHIKRKMVEQNVVDDLFPNDGLLN